MSRVDRRVPVVVSLVSPLVLLLIVLLAVNRDGPVVLSEAAASLDRELRETRPRIVLVGNSTVAQGVEVEAFTAAYGDPELPVSKVVAGGSRAANWYVLLEQRVFGAGLEPELVIVGSTPRWLLHTELESQAAKQAMADHASEFEPVIDEKVYGRERTSALRHRLERARLATRGAYQDWLREIAVGLLFGDGAGSIRERGARVADQALARVFEDERSLDMSLYERVIPVLEQDGGAAVTAGGGSSVEASLVPDLVALAHEHGARILFVYLPYPERGWKDEDLEPALGVELFEALDELGAGWLDMHEGYGGELFVDTVHMNARGRDRFSAELGRAVREHGLLEGGELPRAQAPFFVEHHVRRVGPIPALDEPTLTRWRKNPDRLFGGLPQAAGWSNRGTRAAGLGWISPLVVLEDGVPLAREIANKQVPEPGSFVHISGLLFVVPSDPALLAEPEGHYSLALSEDLPLEVGVRKGWWVYPGTRLEVELSPWHGAPLELDTRLVVEPMDDAPGQPRVTIADAPVTLAPRGHGLEGRHRGRAPSEPWTVTVTVPEDGPMTVVRWLGLQSERGELDLLGSPADIEPPAVDLLSPARRGEASVQGQPVALPLAAIERHETLPLGRATTGSLAPLAHIALSRTLACNRCSPLRLLEDGAPLPEPERSCAYMRRRDSFEGASCLEGDAVLFGASDGVHPLDSGRSYALGFAEQRWRVGGLWLYPGDTVRMEQPGFRFIELRDGASAVVIRAAPFLDHEAGALQLTLEVDGQALLSRAVSPAELAAGELVLPLDLPMAPDPGAVALELSSSPGAPFFYLTLARLGTLAPGAGG